MLLSAFCKARQYRRAQPCALEAPGAERTGYDFRAPSPALVRRATAGAG
jgi:hypothetical protein